MGYKKYDEELVIINGVQIIKTNQYGCYTAEYVKLSGKPYLKEYRQENWYSKTQCLKMKRPVKDLEEPVAFQRAMHGYYPLYLRD